MLVRLLVSKDKAVSQSEGCRVKNSDMLIRAKETFGGRTSVVFVVLFLFVLVAGFLAPATLGIENVRSVIRESSFLGIVALGQGIVMLSGGLDISVGNIMFFVIVYGGNFLARYPEYFPLLCLACLMLGAFIGLINGIGVSKFKISPIIMTLATGSILYGLVYIFGNGRLGARYPPLFNRSGKGSSSASFPLRG